MECVPSIAPRLGRESGGPAAANLGLGCAGDPRLFQFTAIGVVVKAETQGKVWPIELFGQRWKGIRRGNAAPCSSVKGDIARRRQQPHSLNGTALIDDKLNLKLALFEQWRPRLLRDEVVPIPSYILEHTRQIRAKVHAQRVTKNVDCALSIGVWRERSDAVVAAASSSRGCGPRGLLNR